MPATSIIGQQRFLNGEIHDWYRFVWGYSDHLVSGLLDEFALSKSGRVLDPFCGTGTTLVECLKHDYECVGIDASPASLFVSRVKTRWRLKYETLLESLDEVVKTVQDLPPALSAYRDDLTYSYLASSGMLERKWITPSALRSTLAIKHAILTSKAKRGYRDAMMLALLDAVVQDGSNVRFGPELYVNSTPRQVDVIDAFASRVLQMGLDLLLVKNPAARATVLHGDAREAHSVVTRSAAGTFDAVICSPPYPAEHDYTRNARLELALLEAVTGREDVRRIKRTMIRSHTKGIYADDTDWNLVWTHPEIARIARRIEVAVTEVDHGFARLYSTVIASYFGGMYRHFTSIRRVLRHGAQLAYVVSDQASYANIHVPTARILADLALAAGFDVSTIRHWRSRQSSGTHRTINEEILILRLPTSGKRLAVAMHDS